MVLDVERVSFIESVVRCGGLLVVFICEQRQQLYYMGWIPLRALEQLTRTLRKKNNIHGSRPAVSPTTGCILSTRAKTFTGDGTEPMDLV